MIVELRELQASDEEAFYRALSEAEHSTFDFALGYQKGGSFSDYIKMLQEQQVGERLPDGWVPGTLLFGFVKGEIVGRLSIRHKLNDYLLNYGGHIGYGVLDKWNGKGIASEMLRISLFYAKKLEIKRVLLTCDDTNLASKRVIEKCGGIFEDSRYEPCLKCVKLRYWIDL